MVLIETEPVPCEQINFELEVENVGVVKVGSEYRVVKLAW